MDLRELAKNILDAAKAVAPLIVPGAGPAIAAGEAILKAIDNLTDSGHLDPVDQASAIETRAMLEARVHEHAASVAGSLRGSQGG